MKETDWRKTLEVVVKGLVGAVLALAGLWLLGWLFTFVGSVLLGLAGIIGALLRFLIPVAAIAGIVYFVFAQIRPKDPIYSTDSSRREPPEPSSVTPPVQEVATVSSVETTASANETPDVPTSSETPAEPSNETEATTSSETTDETSMDSSQPKKSRRKSS
jgi:hypothetical protein